MRKSKTATRAKIRRCLLAIIRVQFYNPNMSQAFHLFQLQKIDTQIDQANSRITEIQRFLEQDQRLEIARAAVNEKLEALKKSQNHLKKIEQEVAAKRTKLEQSEENLYSGRIHVPKELQDIQNEVAALKRFISNLEDQQLDAMLAVEADLAASESAQAELKRVEAEVSADQASLRGELNRLTASVERLKVERELLEGQISPENQILYEKLRKSRKGIAVASVSDDSCSACGSFLTPADRQATRQPDQIFFCPSCGRIVYGG